MKYYYVYILLCSDNTFYTGMTNDLERRIIQHKSGYNKDSYVFSRQPFELKWYLQLTDPRQAIAIEKQIKGWTRRKKEALINENWKDLVKFSKNYTEYGNPNKDKSSTSSD
ncbi:GIY-YIG nuclease family protein [Flavobacteriaceae bacterium XHP0103]|uniref:GIY-YIG nuclease family protein n=1 Tax=Marixanthotalea marina TaxID=2844359 RepID=UPI002989A19C|nr:GIY-YIG nuclease family protein [Marixanthotalea marina]MBU3821993.1 GIY-YIG nuclease family protein [Marixanthotalea marina]